MCRALATMLADPTLGNFPHQKARLCIAEARVCNNLQSSPVAQWHCFPRTDRVELGCLQCRSRTSFQPRSLSMSTLRSGLPARVSRLGRYRYGTGRNEVAGPRTRTWIETNVHRGGVQRIGPSGRFVRARSRTHYSMPGRRAPLSVRKGRGVVTGGSLSPEQGTSDQPKVQGDDGSLERENVGPASWSACALVLPIASPTALGLRAWRPCLAILWQVFRET